MSDTKSYDENIEVQETNFSSGGGGGGDNVSVSSRGSSHHHHHHQYGHSRGGHHYGRSRYYNTTAVAPGDWKPCKYMVMTVCVVIICAALYVFITSTFEEMTKPPPPPPPPPKAWSGDFSGAYQKQNDGAWAKDSAGSEQEWRLREVASLDGQMYISTKVVDTNGTKTTVYSVKKTLDRGYELRFDFTSGVSFKQRTTRMGKRLLKINYDDEDYHFEDVNSTITVEVFADADRGGKKGIWREVQYSNPEVKIKRIFFDDEMTAIYQSRAAMIYSGHQWDIYVVRFNRRNYK